MAIDMDKDKDNLLVILSCPSPSFVKAGVDIVRELSDSEDGVWFLAQHADIVLQFLASVLRAQKRLSEAAAQALVNLSQNWIVAEEMVKKGMIQEAMGILYKPGSTIRRLMVTLLDNLTHSVAGIASLLLTGDGKMNEMYVAKLVDLFCRSSSSATSDDPFDLVGSLLVKISKWEVGRKILLEPKRQALLKQITRQSDSSSPLKKKEVFAIIRNCCLDAEGQLQNLLMISEFLWPALLIPVAGSKIYNEEETSKMPIELRSAFSVKREAVIDTEIRVQALEAIYLILQQEVGLRAFWSVNGPIILKVGHAEEEDPKAIQAYERVIGSLIVPLNQRHGL